MRSGEKKREKQRIAGLKDIVPDFERWPQSWMGTQEDLEYGKKMLSIMEEFIQHLIARNLSRKTLKIYIDNVWVLGGTIIRDVSMNKHHNEDPRKKILEAVECEGCLPDHYNSMSEEELASFERICKRFEKFLRAGKSPALIENNKMGESENSRKKEPRKMKKACR